MSIPWRQILEDARDAGFLLRLVTLPGGYVCEVAESVRGPWIRPSGETVHQAPEAALAAARQHVTGLVEARADGLNAEVVDALARGDLERVEIQQEEGEPPALGWHARKDATGEWTEPQSNPRAAIRALRAIQGGAGGGGGAGAAAPGRPAADR